MFCRFPEIIKAIPEVIIEKIRSDPGINTKYLADNPFALLVILTIDLSMARISVSNIDNSVLISFNEAPFVIVLNLFARSVFLVKINALL